MDKKVALTSEISILPLKWSFFKLMFENKDIGANDKHFNNISVTKDMLYITGR